MFMNKLKSVVAALLLAPTLLTAARVFAPDAGMAAQVNLQAPEKPAQAEPPPIPAEQFARLHALIKPQPGELRFHEIPWLIDLWEARKKAAAEGKPILVWSGAGGSPVGVC